MMSSFILKIAVTLFLTSCLGVKGDGTALLQESIEHLVNHTAYEALDHLNLKKIGIKVANIAYNDYRDKIGEYN